MTRAHEPCAMCARFTRKGHEHQAAHGLGFCTGYEVYVRADAPPTVLFKPAPAGQINERRAFLEQHRDKQQKLETEKA
jgi:hypothetical protein